MKLSGRLVALFFVSNICVATPSNEDITQLLNQAWQYELELNPIRATSLGEHDYNHLLPDLSPEAIKQNERQLAQFLAQFDAINTDNLNIEQKINLLIQRRNLQNAVDQYYYKAHYVPLTSETGFHSSLAFLPSSTPINNRQDIDNYLQRLSQFPLYFSQQMYWMKQGIKHGLTQPAAVLKDYEQTISAFIMQTPEASQFYKPFEQIENLNLSKKDKASLLQRARDVIETAVFPAYRSLFEFYTKEYFPNAKNNIAAKNWPKGKDYYQNRVEYYTTTNLTAEQIHKIGLEEVARIRENMQHVMTTAEFTGGLNEFIEFLRTDPKFYAKTAEELLKEASYIAKQMDAELPKLFNKLPRTPYGVAPVPDSIAPKYTTGRYIAPTRDDKPGFYWVNTYALDKRPLYALTALTLHEAVPGHHLQNALSREMEELPPVRRFTYLSAFGEGWGLYSEYLGKEVGMYKDPYSEFGRLSYEMWRACRLVVDTGMHIMDWSKQQAVDFMLENTALSEHNINTEVDRYISWPAQALSYKIGELTIKRLRAEAEERLGDKFDLRDFHDAILAHGSVPLKVLEQNIEQFIRLQ